MLIFLYGPDTFRSHQKLTEIIDQYKKANQAGLDLVWFSELDFNKLKLKIESVSMFSEKKLIILDNIFEEILLDYLKENKLQNSQEIILVFYQTDQPDKRTKLFKFLSQKPTIAQNFELLTGANLDNWIKKEILNQQGQIDKLALDKLIFFVGSDLWQLKNEINKLLAYDKKITSQNIDLLVKGKIEINIFDTIDALAQRDKKKALRLLHRHLNQGENQIYLFTMLIYQLRNLLKLKDLEQKGIAYYNLAKATGLHPFVIKKSFSQLRNFSLQQLKNLYHRLLDIDIAIKSGQLDQQLALDLLIAEI